MQLILFSGMLNLLQNFDCEEVNTPMGPGDPHSELIYHDGTVYIC